MSNQVWNIDLAKPRCLRNPNTSLIKVRNAVQAHRLYDRSSIEKTTAFIDYPTVKSMSPTSGTTAGGTTVTITGTGFTGATSVLFGATSATFSVTNDTTISATSPAHAAGTINVTVTIPGGTSSTITGTTFTYS